MDVRGHLQGGELVVGADGGSCWSHWAGGTQEGPRRAVELGTVGAGWMHHGPQGWGWVSLGGQQ